MSKPNVMRAMGLARCPNCREGPIFSGWMRMFPTCSRCGTRYAREDGYFLMAIFMNYLIYGALFAPLALYGYFTNRLRGVAIVIGIGVLLLYPLIYRYGRVLWLYLDQALDPRKEIEQ